MPLHPRLRRASLALALALGFGLAAAGGAAAACYADYKAKREPPLQLHYGVMEIPDGACSPAEAERILRPRLRAGGWQLLQVLGVFGPEGLDARRASAGDFYLRY